MTVSVRILTGDNLAAVLDDVAGLRIAVFRDWPYLYDGDREYERRYIATYRDSPRAVVVGAFDGERLVGAATGTPMQDHAREFADALAGTGVPIEAIFYCAESVLLSAYRGLGIGHAFFDAREDHARSHGFTHAAFCAVSRPDEHPARPAAYQPLDAFWRKRGYARLEGAIADYSWTDLGDSHQSVKPMQFWMRAL